MWIPYRGVKSTFNAVLGQKKRANPKARSLKKGVSPTYFSLSMSFQIPAAQAPPTNGPTMKIQRFARAVPPWKMAGAIERAGFTEVPV
jgi:hypothetical protein